jgi:MerR family transcriptional regulator/heat shock protein HspR
MPRPIVPIASVAERLGLSLRTLRVYEAEGWIRFERVQGRCYLYAEDVEAVAVIERLRRELGANLAGVGVILEMRRTILSLHEEMARLRAAMDEEMEAMRRDLSRPLSRLGPRSVMKVETEDEE